MASLLPWLGALLGAGAAWWFWRRSVAGQRALQASRRELSEIQHSRTLQLAEQETKQQAVFNSMVEGLLILDEDGRVQFANPTLGQLFHLPRDVRGLTLIEALRLHELQEVARRAMTEGRVTGFELHLPGENGRVVQVNAASVRDPEKAHAGTILVFHDLTRIKQLESVRKEFVANVSHELRTPLSLIKGYVETLLDGAKNDPAVATRFLQTIEKHADRLSFLIEDLLTISQLESGSVALNLQPVDLREQVQQVAGELESRAAERGVRLENEVPEGLQVSADADRLQQVLFNLADNAIKYGRQGGQVRLGGRRLEGGLIEGWVADDGPGIPVEAIDRVFERFYRVDRARSREQGGTGLGLSIVKHIIQSHGGEVRTDSAPGKGATFFYTLPAVSAKIGPL